MDRKPLKRSRYFLPLSREHHFGLLFCWKIRQGIKLHIDIGRMLLYVKHFWATELSAHFDEEESLILFDHSQPLVARALSEHQEIEDQIQKLTAGTGYADAAHLNELVEKLDGHIRFEERILFPYLESRFDESQMTTIEAGLQEKNTLPHEHYTDAFWGNQRSSL